MKYREELKKSNTKTYLKNNFIITEHQENKTQFAIYTTNISKITWKDTWSLPFSKKNLSLKQYKKSQMKYWKKKGYHYLNIFLNSFSINAKEKKLNFKWNIDEKPNDC